MSLKEKLNEDFKEAMKAKDKVRKDTITTLNNAAGHIGWELGKRMQIRAIPKFKFVLDEGIAYSVHIADILSKLDLHGENQSDDQ